MRIARGAEQARATVLKRTPVETAELPAAVREVIRRTFGGDLSVGEVVARILRDVREQGDAAVVRFNEEIDGVHGDLEFGKSGQEYHGNLRVQRVDVLQEFDAGHSRHFDVKKHQVWRIAF